MTRGHQRGFALIVVLWTVALLALLASHLLSTARQHSRTAQILRSNARLEAAADGAVFDTILAIIQNNGTADALERVVQIGGVKVEIRLQNEAAKLNPNTATLEAIQAMITGAGIDPANANYLARAIVDWRTRVPESMLGQTKLEQYLNAGRHYAPPNQPYASVDELGLVLGMTPSIFTRLRPFMSVVREEGRAPVSGTLDLSNPADEPGGAAHANTIIIANNVYQIDATARLPDGSRFDRRAVVRIKMLPEFGAKPYEVLAWETPDE